MSFIYRILNFKIYFALLKMVFQKRRTKKTIHRIRNFGFRILDRNDLRTLVQSRCGPLDNKVCHIIGSGWSLNTSKRKIKENDFVIGFNQAALSGLKFDLYFFEFGGHRVEEVSKQQIELAEKVVSKQTDLMIFKNLWEDKNDLKFIKDNWNNKVYYINDYAIPCLDETNYLSSINRLVNNKSMELPQLVSTALTSIAFADFCGFKKIVLHGIDFGGEYFFDASDFDGLDEYRPKGVEDKVTYKREVKDSVHVTSKCPCGVMSLMPILKEVLEHKGTFLYSGSKISPSSKYLKVFTE